MSVIRRLSVLFLCLIIFSPVTAFGGKYVGKVVGFDLMGSGSGIQSYYFQPDTGKKFLFSVSRSSTKGYLALNEGDRLEVYLSNENSDTVFAKYIVKLPTRKTQLSYKELNDFIQKGWDFKVGCSLKEIVNNLGKPKRIKKDGPNFGGEITGSPNTYRYELSYDGIQVATYEVKGKKRKDYFISKCPYDVVITSGSYSVKYDIGIGVSRQAVLNLLGKPHLDKKNSIYYFFNEDEPAYVQFYFNRGRVQKVEWSGG